MTQVDHQIWVYFLELPEGLQTLQQRAAVVSVQMTLGVAVLSPPTVCKEQKKERDLRFVHGR